MRIASKPIFWNIFWCTLFIYGWAEAAIILKGPYLIYPNINTEMRVLWQADETPGVSMIEWGTTTVYGLDSGTLTESGTGAHEHQFCFTMSGLENATRYHYRVIVDSQEATGSFVTAPSDEETSVVIYGYGDTRTNPDDQDRVVEQLMIDVDVDALCRQTLVLHSGDWVGNGEDENAWTAEYFHRSYTNALDFMARMPVMGARGNHEGNGFLLRKYWPYDYQDSSGCYYSFDYGPVHIVVIDQYVSFAPGSPQYAWLEIDLANTLKRWKFVMFHEPAWSAGGGHGNDEDSQKYLCPLFEQYGVAVVQVGHNHYYARCAVNSVHHITAGGGGAPLRTPDPDYPHVVMAEKTHHFVRYDIAGRRLTVTAIRDDGTIIESFRVYEPMALPWLPLTLLED